MPFHHKIYWEKKKKKDGGLPVVVQRVMNLTSIHEDVRFNPGLPQWVKDPVLQWAVV